MVLTLHYSLLSESDLLSLLVEDTGARAGASTGEAAFLTANTDASRCAAVNIIWPIAWPEDAAFTCGEAKVIGGA